ncbi:MAG: glycosyltransferase family 1 protein [Bacteroidota bacterium]|nr:glycosyltransferase family 1 protein [Bacteroidota bacterium]
MKIGIEGQRIFRTKKHGMDMVALELLKNLQKIDKKNEYFVFVKADEDKDCFKENENFKIIELEGGSYPQWEQFALPKAARKYGCDILHCTSNTAPINSKTPLVVTLHDIIYMESFPLFNNSFTWYQRLGNTYRRFVVPKIVKTASKIITVSKFEQKRINDFFGIKDNRLQTVYNGVGEHFQKIDDQNKLEEIRKKYKLPEKFLFFIGNTDPKKNTKGTLTAFSKYFRNTKKPIPLVMPDYDIGELKNILEDIGDKELLEHIHLTGYIVNTDLPAIYNLCSIFIYTSLRESFGIPMLEAMRCGTAVITSNTSSMPEVSGNAALIVDPHSPDEISKAITTIENDKNLRKKLIEEGFKNASKFSWKSMAEDVLKIYEEIYSENKKL